MNNNIESEVLERIRPCRQHPRLLADAARFARIRSLVASDPHAKALFQDICEQADRIMEQPILAYEIPDGKRLLAISRRLVDRIQALGLIWQVTHEPKILERAWAELHAVAAFPDWNPSHFLDTAEMTMGMSIGYDWLYHDLDPSQRQTLLAAITKHGLEPGRLCYEGKADYGWWVDRHNNWNQVCNGGMIAGALAIAEEEPERAAWIVGQAVRSLPLAMGSFAPDGAWFEGPGYWGYAMKYTALGIGCLESALGTDFDLSESEGFDRAADFYIQTGGATRMVFNYADAGGGTVDHPALYWLAKKFNRPDWARYQAQYGKPRAEALLWYEPDCFADAAKALPRIASFRGVEVACARTHWDDPQALYLGVKAGRNGVTHDNLDLGSFIFEALGERWLIDLGKDDYNLPGYFGDLRYTYYRMRAEGHNTLVMNPGRSEPDQDPKAFCKISKAESEDGAAVIATDLTPAYVGRGATNVLRTFRLEERALTLSDAVALDAPGDVWWFFHTRANVCVAEDGRSATLAQGGKTLRVDLDAPQDGTLFVMDARPLPDSPDPAGQNPNNGASLLNASDHFKIVRLGEQPQWGEPDPDKAIRKLAVHLSGVTAATVRFVFSVF